MAPKTPASSGRRSVFALLLLQLGALCLHASEIIVDNAASSGVTITGTWTAATSASGYHGSNYLHDEAAGKGSKSIRYTPSIPVAGDYEVFLRWTAGSNRPTNVPISITSSNGTTSATVNQQSNGGKWNSLGVFTFAAGSSGNILVGTAGTDGYYVIADAVRLVPAGLAEVVVDNNSAGASATGSWTSATLSGQRYGADYLHDNADKSVVKTVRYTPAIPATGLYEVSAWWSAGTNRPDNAPLRVNSASGPADFLANQKIAGGQWNSLGVFPMVAGSHGNLVVSNEGTAAGTYVIADAVRFIQRADIEVIVDNADSSGVTLTGTWPTSSLQSDRYGTSYLHDQNADKGLKSVRFTPTLPEPGNYEVYLYWSGGSTRSSTTPVTVTWAGGASQFPVDQRYNGGKWNSIGTYNFVAGDFGHVEIGNAGTTGHVIADAVRFVRRAKLWTPEDLGDQLWMHWSVDSLPDGAVSSWTDKRRGVVATQSNTSLQPTKQNGEVLFPVGTSLLNFPKQETAHIANRGVMVLFRADVSGSGDSRSLFAVNGISGSAASRQPYVSLAPGSDKIGMVWRTNGGSNALAFPISTDKTQWHCLVSRRTRDFHYASFDGWQQNSSVAGEDKIAMSDWGLEKNPFSSSDDPIYHKGYIGKNDTGPELAIDTIVVTQGELSQENADRLMGWAMWRRGIQDRLPSDHPYRNHPPYVPVPEYQFEESSPAEYQATKDYWNDTSLCEAQVGTPVNLSGWNLVFSDEFDSHSVTHESRGKGNWFAPAHPAATGVATAVYPGVTSDPAVGGPGTPATYVHDAANGTMTIKMQKDGTVWKSGVFCSVNTSGHGRTWLYPYLEVRMRTGPSSTNNWKGAWPAIWLESINYFNNRAESYVEYDIYEGYISDPSGFHNSYHNHDAEFVQPGRVKTDRYISNYFGLANPNNWPVAVNLFDNQYHTYAAMVTPDWVVTYFDGKEVHRFPTPKEMEQPLWILVDLAMRDAEDHLADGVYSLEVDYVKVYQNPAYLP